MTQEAGAQNSQSQSDFVETPYHDQSWEVVGELVENQEFTPMVLDNIPSGVRVLDPMFADYGGFQDAEGDKRWHLPEHLGGSAQGQTAEVAPDNRVHMLPEELEAIKQEAFAAGQAQALTELTEQRLNELKQIEERMLQVFQDISQQMNQELQALESEAVQLAMSVSEKIVGHAVEINPEYITGIIRQALGKAGGANIKTVRVSRQDLEFIEVVGVAKQLKEFDGSWKFEADDTVRSGCILMTSAGEVDFQIDKAWERVRDNIIKSKL
jgi:flagellar biosynthesis/type III secretory pathway protein FliH